MIVFDLGCENNHRFEGWFASNEEFAQQLRRRLITCPSCGNSNIVRLPHAAHVRAGGDKRTARAEPAAAGQQYANVGSEVLVKLIEHIIENTEDVGTAFPEEARKIHYHEAPDRKIRGTASQEEVESLKEEGIEVVALPLPVHRLGKTH